MTMDVLGVLDNPDGESLTFGVRMMKYLQPSGLDPRQTASDLFSTLDFVALRTYFEERLDSLAGFPVLNRVELSRVENYLTH